MHYLKGFNKIKVLQRNKELGCIPTSIEWLLKYHNVEIKKQGKPDNQWDSDFQEITIAKIKEKQLGLSFENVIKVIDDEYEIPNFKLNFDKEVDPNKRVQKIYDIFKSHNGCIIPIPIIKTENENKMSPPIPEMVDFKRIFMDPIKYQGPSHILPIVLIEAKHIFLVEVAEEKPTIKYFTLEHLFINQNPDLIDFCWLSKK